MKRSFARLARESWVIVVILLCVSCGAQAFAAESKKALTEDEFLNHYAVELAQFKCPRFEGFDWTSVIHYKVAVFSSGEHTAEAWGKRLAAKVDALSNGKVKIAFTAYPQQIDIVLTKGDRRRNLYFTSGSEGGFVCSFLSPEDDYILKEPGWRTL